MHALLPTRSVSLRSLPRLLLAGVVLAAPLTAHAAPPTARDCAAASEEALSLRKQEKLQGAKDRLFVCSASTCPAEIRDECSRRMTEVTEAMPGIVFDVKDAAGNDVSVVRVSMDGALLADHLGAAALAIDPGEHTFRFEADGSQPLEKKVVIREGDRNRHIAVALVSTSAPAAVPGPMPHPTPEAAPATPPPSAAAEPSSWSGQKTAALVVGGVGIIGVGIGSVFGLSAFSKWSDAKDKCGAVCGPNDAAQGLKSDAQSAATVSTVTFALGGAALLGAAVLWLTAPSGSEIQVAPSVGAQSTGVTLRGTF